MSTDHQSPARPTGTRRDALLAGTAGALALALYVRTLAPGLTTDVDTAVFQLVGRVLGVPHNPGYPLYVLVTHVFSYVPVGTLAYRINLFSALLGAVTVALTFLLARRLRCGRDISLAAALGLATGHVFWSQAVIAEVYTLHAALVAGILLAMLAWGQTGNHRCYFAAVGLLAAGLGNHLTILGFAPGMAIYGLLVDRRFVLRARTVVSTALLLMAGLVPYALIVIRSNTRGAYVESPATTLRGLVDVALARQFQDRLFAFDPQSIVFERIPHVVRTLAAELTIPALVVATGAAIWLLRRRPAEGLLLLSGCASILAFAVNYRVVDTPVFLIPAILVLWVAAGVGAERLRQTTARRLGVAAGVVVAMLALALPALQLTRNLAVTDRSRDTRAAVQLDRLFAALRDRTAVVREDFLVDRMMRFKLLGEKAAGDRAIEIVSRDARRARAALARGDHVMAFPKSARLLRLDGLAFGFAQVQLLDGPLDEHLSRLPDGAVVALAVPGHHTARFAASRGVRFASIGGPSEIEGRPSSSFAIVGVRGARRGARVESGLRDVRLSIAAGERIGDTRATAPSTIEAWSGVAEAAIRIGPRDVVRTSQGVAMVTWDTTGRVIQTCVLQAHEQFQVPVPRSPLSVFALGGEYPRVDVTAQDWSDLEAFAKTGSVLLHVPAGQGVLLYVADDDRLAPRTIERSSTRAEVRVVPFERAGDALQKQLAEDHAADAGLHRYSDVYRIHVGAPPNGAVSVHLALGGIPARVIGRATRPAPVGAPAVFSVAVDDLLRTPDRASEVLAMGRDEQAQLTGAGWSDADRDAAGPFRWMTASESRLVLPIGRRDVRTIRVQALTAGDTASTTLRVRLNGSDVLPPERLEPGWHMYEWTLPAAAVVAPGINDVVLVVDRPPAPGGQQAPPPRIAIAEVRVLGQ